MKTFPQKVMIIAEVGVNHNGCFETAKKCIDAAKEIGADVVKFQTWKTEELMIENAPLAEYQNENCEEDTQFKMAKNLELSFESFKKLKEYSESIGVSFLSTPDDLVSLDFLVDELGMETIKIGSGEVTNLPFLKKIAQKKKNVILSTGMSNLAEVETAVTTLEENGAKEITVLHCVSSYPAPMNSLNLRAICSMQEALKIPTGFSDHTEGSIASIVAVGLGATIIEKHFTLDREQKGPDHKSSLDPRQFKEFVNAIREAEVSLKGSGRKEVQEIEKSTKNVVQKGVYFKKQLPKGHVLTEEDLCFLRPKTEIKMEHYPLFIGQVLKRDVQKNDPVHFSKFSFD
ncbi:MAG: N-acetylneuraminate synthase [Halobacteriovoraceae bacterium]|nr:N-acetylneuraminate synthase [Halobacteriovoraceae bacterium]